MSHSMGGQKAKYRFRRQLIKSIQSGIITIATGSTSNTYTLPIAVDKTKSIIIWNGMETNNTNTNANETNSRVELTDPNTVTLSTNSVSTGSGTRSARFQVIEFFPWAVINVEHSTISVAAAVSNTKTPAFTPTKAKNTFCIYLGCTTASTGDFGRLNKAFIDISHNFLTNVITGAYQASQTASTTGGYCLVEFAEGIVLSRNEVFMSMSSGNTLESTIATVNPANTLTLLGGLQYSDGFYSSEVMGFLKDGSTTRMESDASSSVIRRIRLLTLEFQPRWVRKKQSGQNAVTVGQATTDVTVASNLPGKMILSYLHRRCPNPFDAVSYVYTSILEQGAATMRMERAASGDFGNVPTVSWEEMEMQG